MSYRYRARDKLGRIHSGKLMAGSKTEAIRRLRSRGLFVTGLYPSETGSRNLLRRRRVTRRELARVFGQLSTLLASGLPLVKSLQRISAQGFSPPLQEALLGLAAEVSRGTGVADAFELYPDLFPLHLAQMVRAGVKGGILADVLSQAALQYKREAELAADIRRALLYPALVLTVSAAVLAFLVFFVLPSFASLFGELGLSPPLPTRLVLYFGRYFRENVLLLLCGAFLGGLVLRACWLRPGFRELRLGFLLRLPLFGDLLRSLAVARVSRVLASLLKSGIPLNEALPAVSGLFACSRFRRCLEELERDVREGQSLAGCSLEAAGPLAGLISGLLAVGESTGRLADVLDELAEYCEQELDSRLKEFAALIEPGLMLFLGLIVGFFILATVLPLFEMMTVF